MFERSIESLIKGFRSHRGKDEAKYLASVLAEIRHEVRGGDMEIKAEGILKLVYLQMLGHVSSKAAFHVVEVMASSRYHLKFIGYLGAAQCLEPGADVLILATNLIKKDLASRFELDISSALGGLSSLMTPDLSQHFAADVISMLNHSKPAIRKKAILALHAIIAHHPETLHKAWTRLQDRLEDDDPSVISVTVSILCEFARRDPQPFLPFAPQLFKLLTTSTNNWILIKVVKLFGSLSTCEPRLSRRLLPPITSIIVSTPAMSLLYECIHTIIVGDMLSSADGRQLAQNCVEKLAHFLEDQDQNLNFIALVALIKILPSHPHLVEPYLPAVRDMLKAQDSTIRIRALTLLLSLTGKTSFQSFCQTVEQAVLAPKKSLMDGKDAASKLRSILSTRAGGGKDEQTSVVEQYAVTTKRQFDQEAALCLAVAGAKDNYANVSDFKLFATQLLSLSAMGTEISRRVAERVMIDIVRRGFVSSAEGHQIQRDQNNMSSLPICILHGQASRSADEITIRQVAAALKPTMNADWELSHSTIELLLRSRPIRLAAAPEPRRLTRTLSEGLGRPKHLLTAQRSAEGLRLLCPSRYTGRATTQPPSPIEKTSRSTLCPSRSCWRWQHPARAAREGVFARHTKSVTPVAPSSRQAHRQSGLHARQQHRSGSSNPFILSGPSQRIEHRCEKPAKITDLSADDLSIPIVQLDIFASEPSAEDAVAKETAIRAIRGGERKHGRKNVANIV